MCAVTAVATTIGNLADVVLALQTAATQGDAEAQLKASKQLALLVQLHDAQLAVQLDPTNEQKLEALNALTP